MRVLAIGGDLSIFDAFAGLGQQRQRGVGPARLVVGRWRLPARRRRAAFHRPCASPSPPCAAVHPRTSPRSTEPRGHPPPCGSGGAPCTHRVQPSASGSRGPRMPAAVGLGVWGAWRVRQHPSTYWGVAASQPGTTGERGGGSVYRIRPTPHTSPWPGCPQWPLTRCWLSPTKALKPHSSDPQRGDPPPPPAG
jgi:hypothetical protein